MRLHSQLSWLVTDNISDIEPFIPLDDTSIAASELESLVVVEDHTDLIPDCDVDMSFLLCRELDRFNGIRDVIVDSDDDCVEPEREIE